MIRQRGRCQVEVEVIGKSASGAMPELGINPLEYGALIIAEAAAIAGEGSRTITKTELDTPSDGGDLETGLGDYDFVRELVRVLRRLTITSTN
jgi:acetylornithine deacetylase/succinyl-diaminopimelate desuccinylase-like protein